MNKVLVISPMIFSIIIVFAAWGLASYPHPSPIGSNGIPMPNAPPPTSNGEVIVLLMIPGILVCITGIAQAIRRIKLAGWQIFLGLAVVVSSLYILTEESLIPGFVRYQSTAYWLTVFGVAILCVAVMQFREQVVRQ
jgi:hypothetical protein